MAGKRAEIAKERKLAVVAVLRGGIANQAVDHRTPLIGPSRFKLLEKRSRVDKIPPVKMVIVDVGVLAVTCGVTQHRRPIAVVVEQEGHLAGGVSQPVFQPVFNGRYNFIGGSRIAHFVRNSGCLDQTVHQLSFVVGIGPEVQLVVLDLPNFFIQFGRIKSGTVRA